MPKNGRANEGRRTGLRGRLPWAACLLALLLVAALVAGCGSDDGDGGASTGAAGTGAAEGEFAGTIKLGVNVELSGPAANIGTSLLAGYQGAVDQINEGGGVAVGDEAYELEIVECDNRSEPTQGVACARRATEDGSLWAMTPDYGFDAAYEILKGQDVIAAATSASATVLLGEDPEANPGLFFQGVTFDVLVESFLSQAQALMPGVKSFAALLPDDENGTGYEALFKPAAEKVGIEYKGAEFYPPDATGDFSSFLTKLKAKNADLVYLSFVPQVTVPAAQQAGELDVAPYFGGQSLVPEDFAGTNLSGHEMVIQNLALSDVSADQQSQENQEAWKAIEAAAGGEETTGNVSGLAYLEIRLLQQAIEAAESVEPQAVQEAMLTAKWDGALGPAVVQENHSFTSPMSAFHWDSEGNVTENIFAQPLDLKPAEVFEIKGE